MDGWRYWPRKFTTVILNYKRFLTKCRDGWMEALADKAHKQGEHIPQHSHNHPYISSSDTPHSTKLLHFTQPSLQ